MKEVNEDKNEVTTKDNKEMVAHGTQDFRMSVHTTNVEKGMHIALYYHWHDELEILHVTKGNLRFILGQEEHHLCEGDILCITKGVPHMAYRMDEEELEYHAVLIHLDFLASQENDIIQKCYILPVFWGWTHIPHYILKDGQNHKEMVLILKKIYEYYGQLNRGYELMIKGLLFQFMYYLMQTADETRAGKNPYQEEWVRNMLYFIKENYQEKITLQDMAAYVHMSNGHFCRSMKKTFQLTPVEFLSHYRVTKAVRLIETTKKKMTEIAYEVGFQSFNRFHISFKQVMECTPIQYRRRMNNQKEKE